MTNENLMDDAFHRFCNIRLHHSSIHKTAGLEGSKHLLFHKKFFFIEIKEYFIRLIEKLNHYYEFADIYPRIKKPFEL